MPVLFQKLKESLIIFFIAFSPGGILYLNIMGNKKKGKIPVTYRKQGEPSIEDRRELALIYIQQLRGKKVEPTVESLVKRYLISEEIAAELLSRKSLQAQTADDIIPLAKID